MGVLDMKRVFYLEVNVPETKEPFNQDYWANLLQDAINQLSEPTRFEVLKNVKVVPIGLLESPYEQLDDDVQKRLHTLQMSNFRDIVRDADEDSISELVALMLKGMDEAEIHIELDAMNRHTDEDEDLANEDGGGPITEEE
jgi:hypothetical protein